MCARWKKEYDPNLLVNRLEELKIVNTSDRISFRGFEFEDVVTVLHSAIDFKKDLPEEQQRRILFDSVFSVARSGRLTAPSLLTQINREESYLANRPVHKFVLATSLSIRHFDSLRSTQVSGHRITFTRFLPKQFYHAHEEARKRTSKFVFGELPDPLSSLKAYTSVRVSVQHRSEQEALTSALDALDLLRGIWNLYFRKWARSSVGRREPVNSIVLGPVHSLHEPGGKIAAGMFWYEADYVGPLRPQRLDKDYDALRRFEKQVRELLSRSNYRADAEAAVRRYTRALDFRDWDTSFVQLWGLIEQLTDTSRASYETTIKRILFLCDRRYTEFHRQILRHLMNYRNRTVHAGVETVAIETLLYQLKRYAEVLLIFHVQNSSQFSSIKEAAEEYLSLPLDLNRLRSRIDFAERALRFHER